MVKKVKKYLKFVVCCALILSLIAPSYAALSASDGSAFVTKAEFDSALADFNARLTTFEAGINSKIDSQVTSYLDRNGIWNGAKQSIVNGLVSPYSGTICTQDGFWVIPEFNLIQGSAFNVTQGFAMENNINTLGGEEYHGLMHWWYSLLGGGPSGGWTKPAYNDPRNYVTNSYHVPSGISANMSNLFKAVYDVYQNVNKSGMAFITLNIDTGKGGDWSSHITQRGDRYGAHIYSVPAAGRRLTSISWLQPFTEFIPSVVVASHPSSVTLTSSNLLNYVDTKFEVLSVSRVRIDNRYKNNSNSSTIIDADGNTHEWLEPDSFFFSKEQIVGKDDWPDVNTGSATVDFNYRDLLYDIDVGLKAGSVVLNFFVTKGENIAFIPALGWSFGSGNQFGQIMGSNSFAMECYTQATMEPRVHFDCKIY